MNVERSNKRKVEVIIDESRFVVTLSRSLRSLSSNASFRRTKNSNSINFFFLKIKILNLFVSYYLDTWSFCEIPKFIFVTLQGLSSSKFPWRLRAKEWSHKCIANSSRIQRDIKLEHVYIYVNCNKQKICYSKIPFEKHSKNPIRSSSISINKHKLQRLSRSRKRRNVSILYADFKLIWKI